MQNSSHDLLIQTLFPCSHDDGEVETWKSEGVIVLTWL